MAWLQVNTLEPVQELTSSIFGSEFDSCYFMNGAFHENITNGESLNSMRFASENREMLSK